jgi:hypothetical protein
MDQRAAMDFCRPATENRPALIAAQKACLSAWE